MINWVVLKGLLSQKCWNKCCVGNDVDIDLRPLVFGNTKSPLKFPFTKVKPLCWHVMKVKVLILNNHAWCFFPFICWCRRNEIFNYLFLLTVFEWMKIIKTEETSGKINLQTFQYFGYIHIDYIYALSVLLRYSENYNCIPVNIPERNINVEGLCIRQAEWQ